MFRQIISRTAPALSKHGIPYVIIGGQAVLVHGEPRLTRDIDISLGIDTSHLREILQILEEIALEPIPGEVEAFVAQTLVLPARDMSTGIRVDFIFSNSLFESEAIARAGKVSVLGQEVNFASPEDLIIHKIVAGRELDLQDVSSVLLRNSSIDSGYIRKWLKSFDETFPDKRFLDTYNDILKKTTR